MGKVLAINQAEKLLFMAFDGNAVSYEALELDELALAYALTIHKSQGSEYPAVVVPAEGEQPLHHAAAEPALHGDHTCAKDGGVSG